MKEKVRNSPNWAIQVAYLEIEEKEEEEEEEKTVDSESEHCRIPT